jgi:thiosulfate/3-mercaptopyruvate sulfurtransferase
VKYQFVDCRWELGSPERGRELYLEGHVPGASFLDVERELSAPPASPGGRHPLPSAEDFARAAGAAGIGSGVFVVAYDQGMTGGAARLWWLLRHFGHDDVAVLAGGLGAWAGPLRAGEESVEPAELALRPREGDTIEAGELAARLDDERLTIVDARLPERYRGEVEPIDPVAGRIPGARNAPFPDELPPDLLGAGEIVAYCGSGITAAVVLLRLAAAGREDAKLYPGSWSDWCARGLPAETGPSPAN